MPYTHDTLEAIINIKELLSDNFFTNGTTTAVYIHLFLDNRIMRPLIACTFNSNYKSFVFSRF
jgi:hypothetical protein